MLYLKELISLTTYLYFQNEKKTVILCLPVLEHFVFLMNNFRSSPNVNHVNKLFLKWKHGRWGSPYVKSKFHKKNSNFICKYFGKHGSQIPSASILLYTCWSDSKTIALILQIDLKFFCIFISPSTCKEFRNKWINEKSNWSVRRKTFFVCVLIRVSKFVELSVVLSVMFFQH